MTDRDEGRGTSDEQNAPLAPRLSSLVPVLEILRASRPRQWTKNLLVYAGFLFTLNQTAVWPAFGRATFGFIVFCLLPASAYLLNDARDAEADRRHPLKRHRPVAGGRLSVRIAYGSSVVLALAGLAGAVWAGPAFAVIAAVYLAVTVAYSLALKHVVLLDVLALAAGYVLRAVAGAAILSVRTSFWLALCTFLLALFLGLCKRRSEITALDDAGDAQAARAILGEYTVDLLDQMISVATACALLAYALYTYFTPTTPDPGAVWLFRQHLFTFTIPFVVYGIYSYLYLAYRHDLGGAPETLFLEDRPLQWNILLWVAACAAALLLGPDVS